MSPLLAAPSALTPAASEPWPSKAASRHAVRDGHRIHYAVVGSGKDTLVFVHGWTCDLTAWRRQVPAFARSARLVLVDLPGHGGSDAPEADYTMDFFADAVDAVLRDAGVSRAVLVGHSMGTPVARQFLRRHPEKTAALVAVDGSLRVLVTGEGRERWLAPFRGPAYRARLEHLADFLLPADMAPARAQMKAVMTKTPQRVAVSAAESMLDPAYFAEDPIHVPFLSVLARSPSWDAGYEALVRRVAPHVDYRIMEGVGHFPMLQRPDEFNAILADFLAKALGGENPAATRSPA